MARSNFSRRRLLRTAFCSSAALALNLRPAAAAPPAPAPDALHLLAIGDFAGDLVKAWGPLFEEHCVHAYLCGHDHDLQHLELEGLRTSFVISGGGGARTRKMRTTDRMMPFGQDVYGFTHIQVLPDRLVFAHHGIQGELLHRFEKQADGRVTVS